MKDFLLALEQILVTCSLKIRFTNGLSKKWKFPVLVLKPLW